MKKNYFLPAKLLTRCVLAASLFSGTAIAQPGTNDPTFDTPDSGPNSVFKGSNDWVTNSALSGSKIVLTGRFTAYNGASASRIVKLNANGSTDAGFISGTGFNAEPSSVVVQNNNRIVVAGGFTNYNGTTANRIVRLLANGTIDNTYLTGTGFNAAPVALLLQTDGKIIVAGSFTTYNGTSVHKVVRLNTNGTLDNTFSAPGVSAPKKAALQPDGKIILGYSAIDNINLIRLNTNGSTDITYSASIPVNDTNIETEFPTLAALAVQADGKVLVGGHYIFGNSPPIGFLRRADVNGSVDTSFHTPSEYGGGIFSINLQSDGKIIVGGKEKLLKNTSQTTSTVLIARLNTNGTADNTFFHNDILMTAQYAAYTTSILADGKIIVGGFFTELSSYGAHNIGRLNADGTLDIAFNKVTGANGDIKASAVQSNGRIVIGGNFSAFHYQSRSHIARLHENGSLDNSFNPGTGTNGPVHALAIQPDGKILVAGNFSIYNGQPAAGIVRVNSNGSIDATFNAGTGANGTIYSVTVHAGKIVIGGDFTEVQGTGRNCVARLNADGSLDAGFTSPIVDAFSINVFTGFVHSSGKLLIGGHFSTGTRNDFVRLENDGSVDTSFLQGYSYDVRSIAEQPDGKLVVSGGTEPYNTNMGYGYVNRHLADGSDDNSFVSGFELGQTFPVYSITLLNSGKIIAGGHFNYYGGVPVHNIMLLDSTGVVDTSFTGSTDGTVLTTKLVADEKVIIGGAITNYSGIARNGIARIYTENDAPYAYGARVENTTTIHDATAAFTIYPNPASNAINFDQLTPGSTIVIRNILGSVVHTEQVNNSKVTLNLSGYRNGIYLITQVGAGKTSMKKFVVAGN